MAGPDVSRLRDEFQGPRLLVTASDGKTLFVRRWGSQGAPGVSVLILHGITGYSGPYGPMIAEPLAAAGFGVFGMDLRGHGLSDGRRGDYPSPQRFADDLCETVAKVRSLSRKLVVLGHSLGVLSAMVAVNNCGADIDGLVLLSAAKRVKKGVFGRPGAAAVLRAMIAASILRGTPLIDYRRSGMQTGDPLYNFRYSARFYSALYGMGALKVSRMFQGGAIESPNLHLKAKLRVPLLVGVGSQDEIFSVDAAKEFFDGLDCDDKEFFVVDGAKHATFPRDASGRVTDWLGRKF